MELERLVRVSLSIPIFEQDLLLIRREKNPFKGLLGLPGGKVERTDNDYYEAFMREMKEELNSFVPPIHGGGILYEKIFSEGKSEYFAMHIFVMYLDEYDDVKNVERIPISELENYKEQIIPSDYTIIDDFFQGKRNRVYQAVTISMKNNDFVTEWNDITGLEYKI